MHRSKVLYVHRHLKSFLVDKKFRFIFTSLFFLVHSRICVICGTTDIFAEEEIKTISSFSQYRKVLDKPACSIANVRDVLNDIASVNER